MPALYAIFLAFSVACAPSGTVGSEDHQRLILFVGNSLTYVGNTPAVLDALAASNGVEVASDMIVKGGATLTQQFNDGSVARALSSNRYSALVLQERGGDLLCSFGPSSCMESRKAIQALASLGKSSGAKVYLLGTYQVNPRASDALVAAESAAASEAGIPYLEISNKLQTLRTVAPTMEWLSPDGMHPGPGLALLNAVVLHQALLGKLPEPAPLTIHAPIYGATSGLSEMIRSAQDPPPLESTPRDIEYSANSLRTVLGVMSAQGGG